MILLALVIGLLLWETKISGNQTDQMHNPSQETTIATHNFYKTYQAGHMNGPANQPTPALYYHWSVPF